MAATPYEILTYVGRGTGSRDYQRLKAALDRLQSTTISTSIRQPAEGRRHRFSWINEWQERTDRNGRPDGIEMIVPDWFYQAVLDDALVLTIDRTYFDLTGGLDRWLYRLVRKHGGRQRDGWRFDFHHFHQKSGSLSPFKRFAFELRDIIRRQPLPGYTLFLEAEIGGRMLLAFEPVPPCGKPVNGLVLSGTRTIVLSGTAGSCYREPKPSLTNGNRSRNRALNLESNIDSNLEERARDVENLIRDTARRLRIEAKKTASAAPYSSEPSFYISFGINENGLFVMWLGDIAKLPETEQYYLRSENVPSDHHIGSEFYEGQIEAKFTEEAPENKLFRLRSELNEASRSSLGFPIFQVSSEILDSAILVRDPIFDTKTSRAQVAQALNDVYVESLEAGQLKKHVKAQDVDVSNIKGIKLLEQLMITLGYSDDLRELMKSFYLIYDLLVSQSHLMTTNARREKVNSVAARLGMDDKATFADIYEKIRDALCETLIKMEATLKGPSS